MSTFKLQPNEFGSDNAQAVPALEALKDFCRALADNDANGSGRVALKVELGPREYAALRTYSQRPYKPRPSRFTMYLEQAGHFFGTVEFVRTEDASDATKQPEPGATDAA